jgi:hypothetical protein
MAVGITLDQIAAPGATPITPNATSAKTFANDYAKVNVPNLSSQDRKTLAILGLIYKLNNAGGANYKTNHAGLIQDATVYTGGISQFSLEAAMAALDWNTGNVADVTLSTDVPTLMKEGRDLDDLPVQTLDRIIAFLRAQMRT